MATYLELINKVLVRLRQPEVTDLSDPYTLLIGQFINQAKEEIEDAGPWRALRTEIAVATVQGSEGYALTGANERSYVLKDRYGRAQAWRNDSGHKRLIQQLDLEDMRQRDFLDANEEAEPTHFAIRPTGSPPVPWVQFHPVPDAVYNYGFTMVVPQDELTAASTVITIPSRPVWMLAAAYAAAERGEELSGTPGMSMMQEAVRAINDAVLIDFGAEQNGFFLD